MLVRKQNIFINDVRFHFALQSFRRLLLSKCQEEFESRADATASKYEIMFGEKAF